MRVNDRALGLYWGAAAAASVALAPLAARAAELVPPCLVRSMTGLPCPTCGSTRTLGRLAALDFAGAWSQNPLAAAAAFGVAGWALADLVLLPRRKALGLEVEPRLGLALRWGALLLFLANWAYLVAAGR